MTPPRDIAGVTRDFRDDDLRQIEAKWKSDIDRKIDRLSDRVAILERMMWVGVGGLAMIAGMIGMYGQKILHLLAG